MKEEDIIARVKENYPDAVIDAAGADCNFELFVISAAFEGKSLLQRQRAVLGLFTEELKTGALHALSVTAKTPVEPLSAPHLVQVTIN
jgi:acid stress-induced BolA-like protein IbaG/YrbA